MVEAFISKDMLRWAIGRSFQNPGDASEALNIRYEKLNEWWSGNSRPTFNQAQELAKKLKIPFGYLYLSAPPKEELPLPDLRTRPSTKHRKPSPDFLEVLYDALRKQEWYHEYLQGIQTEPLPFVGLFSVGNPTKSITTDIRKRLKLDDGVRNQVRDWEEFFRYLVRAAESIGILVIRNSVVGNNTHRPLDADEFQGFAISDSLAPLVFVNQADYLSAQIFTLAHELAHIWMGISGVSNLEYLERPQNQEHHDERATDAVAAEVLVPAETFELKWDDVTDVDDGVNALAKYFRVSRFVILRRAFELHKISINVYRSKYEELIAQVIANKKKRHGGGSGFSNVFSRNSSTLTSTLLHSVLEGNTSPKEASQLLNIRMSKLRGLETFLSSIEG